MKNIISIFILFSLLYPVELFADDCTDALTEAKTLYNSGNYQKAKELFEYVQSECPQNYTEASNWIAKCDNALKPKTSNTKQSTSKTSSSTGGFSSVVVFEEDVVELPSVLPISNSQPTSEMLVASIAINTKTATNFVLLVLRFSFFIVLFPF